MSDSERQAKEELISLLKLVHKTHQQLADRGVRLYGMTPDESLDYRLDIMAQIAELQKELDAEND